MKIYYLGPNGTYSETAAKEMLKGVKIDIEFAPVVSLEAVVKSVVSSGTDMGVVAYYNYLEGLVQECLDLIYENNLRIIRAKRIPIVLSLGSCGNGNGDVYSHPKALAQCSEYLWKNYPGKKQIPTTSTAAAAKIVSETNTGLAIASSEALKEYGKHTNLEIIAEDIGNKKNRRLNFTDFYLVAKENNMRCEKGKEYMTMVAIIPHTDEIGLLAGMLTQVAYHGINNAKIHSRPALDNVESGNGEPQMFYLEMMCHKDSEDFRRCIDSLKYKLTPKGKDVEVVRVLGSYEKPIL